MVQYVKTEMTKPLDEKVIESLGGFVPMEKFVQGVRVNVLKMS
jgi:ribosomal protein S16